MMLDVHSAITDDIVRIYHGVQHCLDLRRKYVRTSLQRSNDNPKNNVDRWNIYPPPPPPRWTCNPEDGTWKEHKNDYTKCGVGEDFNFEDCHIPSTDPRFFYLQDGVFQVYPDENCKIYDCIAYGSNRAHLPSPYTARVLSRS